MLNAKFSRGRHLEETLTILSIASEPRIKHPPSFSCACLGYCVEVACSKILVRRARAVPNAFFFRRGRPYDRDSAMCAFRSRLIHKTRGKFPVGFAPVCSWGRIAILRTSIIAIVCKTRSALSDAKRRALISATCFSFLTAFLIDKVACQIIATIHTTRD